MNKSKRHLYQNDSISRIFQLGGDEIEEIEIPEVINEEGESGGEVELSSRNTKSLQNIITLSWGILAWSAL